VNAAGVPETPKVTIKFDADQPHQLAAIESVVRLFHGQPIAASPNGMAALPGSDLGELGTGNALTVASRQIGANLREVQEQNAIPPHLQGALAPEGGPGSLDFSVEMETGTGKTYAYLRTIFELHKTYGWTKFVIVVPSVAIREGVESSLRLLSGHLATLYDGVHYDNWVYDSKVPSRLRIFAQADYLQILVINIDAFNRPDTNLIFRSQDQMMGQAPIEFIRAAAPIVILDEPQNMESDTARIALAGLSPLFILRYSATHLHAYHQIFRLTPAAAYQAGLVKQIEVWSVQEDENANRPFIRLKEVAAGKKSITARIELDVRTPSGVRRKTVACSVARNRDLREVADREAYEGYVIAEIRTGEVEFENGVMVTVGQALGADRDVISRVQIQTAVAQHFDRELEITERVEAGEISPTKVLSLFFVDRVENYWPADAKFRRWFEAEYERLRKRVKYAPLDLPPVRSVHDGYFAKDRATGVAKDTRGRTLADGEAYELIMRDKERLLSLQEPLRFIFSHSALREGWDNPNVFVITTLDEGRSEIRKRQEIGRGLRLPVMSDGTRCANREVATLAIVANESYDEFAAQLQEEIEEETGTEFDRRAIKSGRSRRRVELRTGYQENPAFLALWERIKTRTTYRVEYDSDALVQAALRHLAEQPPVEHGFVRAKRAALDVNDDGVSGELLGEKAPIELQEKFAVPDLLSYLSETLPVSRATIARILSSCGRLGEAAINPQQFIEQVQAAIRVAAAEQMVEGIRYTQRPQRGGDSEYNMRLFAERELVSYEDNLVPVDKSIYSDVVYDSEVERKIALALNSREDVVLFLKLPDWFQVETPLGSYNPDWAIVKADAEGKENLFLVRESKGTRDLDKLRLEERLKILFAAEHFKAIGASFGVVDSASQI
jgi:type III restriction enzyme